MFKNLKLAFKIGGGFACVLALSLLTATIAIGGLTSVAGSASRSAMANEAIDLIRNGVIGGKNYVITKSDSYVDTIGTSMDKVVTICEKIKVQVKDPANVKRIDEIVESVTSYKENFNAYVSLNKELSADTAKLATAGNKINDDLTAIMARQGGSNKELYSLLSLVSQFRLSSRTYVMDSTDAAYNTTVQSLEEATKIARSVGTLEEDIHEYSTIFDEMRTINLKKADVQSKAAKQAEVSVAKATELAQSGSSLLTKAMNSTRALIIMFTLCSLIVGTLLSIVVTRAITKAMALGVAFTEEISNGNLNAKLDIDQKDEIGQLATALKTMSERLRDIVEQIQGAASQVSSGSQQLSSTSQQMSQGATEQAASLEEISSSMEQMTSNIRQNAENAMTTEKISHKSSQIAEEGGKAVNDTVDAMKLIASKIGIIEEIARSTNMLALNASIEAARAGEYGKGFAVVASEVGKLAERSQKEAGEISKLSTESVQVAERAGVTINGMIPEIKRTAELVQEISAASAEQNTGAEQINAAIMQLDQVVQQNASASEESASMSEELASQAEEMHATLSFFRIDESGSSSHAARKPATIAATTASVAKAAPTPASHRVIHVNHPPKFAQAAPVQAKTPTGIDLHLDDDPAHDARDQRDGDFKQF
ncbi:MAG TPA: methyl-accepting chemotaxis protein [Treponemataceae bacterium]|nr:methyl-accepting chemotaxis protein [Treponemataceae bacterium]HPS44564.1 methyl-accepting chemotaxis protein [Treponemataceae bacterium]